VAQSFLRHLIRNRFIDEVGINAFVVWLVLRDRIWRSSQHGPTRLIAEWKSGHLSSDLSLREIRSLTGLSKGTVINAIKKLEAEGWVECVRQDRTRTIYRLGTAESGEESYLAGSNPEPVESESGPNPELPPGPNPEPDKDPSGPNPEPASRRGKDEEGKKKEGKRIRKVKQRNTWTTALAPKEPVTGKRRVVEYKGRKLSSDEHRHLMTAISKKGEGREKDYSAEEMVAAYRNRYFSAFAVEDVELRTKAARVRAVKLIEKRSKEWTGGDRSRLFIYLAFALRRWSKALSSGEKIFPAGLPSLFFFLGQKGDRVPWIFKEWQSRTLRDDRPKR
jgi:DNA-binding transcriptional ArsR family regulator